MEESDKQNEIRRLLQLRRIETIEKPTGSAFVCVHSVGEAKNGLCTFCYLLPKVQAEKFLEDVGWYFRYGDFVPHVECIEHAPEGKWVRDVHYLRDGNNTGAEALVHTRYFASIKPQSVEISEEFRLFHNLYHDETRNLFLHYDVHGQEYEVVRVNEDRIEIQLRFLTDFLRAKQMHLAMQWDGAHFCKYSLKELGLQPELKTKHEASFHWEFSLKEDNGFDECKCISKILGKALIFCPGPVEYNDPFEEDHSEYPAYIIGHNEHGEHIVDTCDPKEIKGDVGRGLRPVFFKRGVLGKYFAEPAKFSIEDGCLRCGGLWLLKMDNDHPKYVTVFLDDLGEDLPKAERDHWRSFNVPPDGGISETAYIRNIRGWFAEAKMPDLRLKRLYPKVNALWQEAYGWPLWREPSDEDRYIFNQVHVCLEENQAEFDQQNSLLAKLLNDFLNEDKIKSSLCSQPSNPGGLNRFQQFLLEAGHADAEQRIRPLRVIQDLRSKGSAHRKSDEYLKAIQRASLNNLGLVEASMKVFIDAVAFIEWLKTDVLKSSE